MINSFKLCSYVSDHPSFFSFFFLLFSLHVKLLQPLIRFALQVLYFFFKICCFYVNKVCVFLFSLWKKLETFFGYVESENGEVVPWKIRRSLADETTTGNSTLILAAVRTQRRDPLENFKKYTGGWNISEQHYWAVSFFPFFFSGDFFFFFTFSLKWGFSLFFYFLFLSWWIVFILHFLLFTWLVGFPCL